MTCPGDTNLEAESRLVVARHVGDNGERVLMHEVFLRGDENGLKLAWGRGPLQLPPQTDPESPGGERGWKLRGHT